LFPKADAGNFILEVRLKSGTRVEKSAELAKNLEEKLRGWIEPQDLEMILINVGVYYGFPEYCSRFAFTDPSISPTKIPDTPTKFKNVSIMIKIISAVVHILAR
jgi:multidrug efflux pump subunit AcrB